MKLQIIEARNYSELRDKVNDFISDGGIEDIQYKVTYAGANVTLYTAFIHYSGK